MRTTDRPSRMQRLAGFAQRHHWTALLTWVVLLVALTAVSQMIGDDYGNGSDVSITYENLSASPNNDFLANLIPFLTSLSSHGDHDGH